MVNVSAITERPRCRMG